MEQALYLNDSYMKEFEAGVVSVKDEKYIVLDKTAFYPASGGQPYDTGTIIRKSDNKEFKIVYAGKFSGQISHEVSEPGLQQGDAITGKIDWERRYKLMRHHTAAHIVSQVIHKDTGALITGNQLDLEKSRIDFNVENFNREIASNYVQKANEVIKRNLEVKFYTLPREEVDKREELLKLAKGLPPQIKKVRIVEIGDFDKQADGGTHVKNTSEIGEIEFIKCDNKGANNRRIYFKIK